MGTFRITVDIADPSGQRFEPVEMLVDTGATFTKGSRIERTRGRTIIRLEGKEFPTPVTFGEEGEQNLLGAMALEDAMLAVDPHSKRLLSVHALEMTEQRQ